MKQRGIIIRKWPIIEEMVGLLETEGVTHNEELLLERRLRKLYPIFCILQQHSMEWLTWFRAN